MRKVCTYPFTSYSPPAQLEKERERERESEREKKSKVYTPGWTEWEALSEKATS